MVSYMFFNPRYKDDFTTTNSEAFVCGITIITYNTGESPESARNKGIVV